MVNYAKKINKLIFNKFGFIIVIIFLTLAFINFNFKLQQIFFTQIYRYLISYFIYNYSLYHCNSIYSGISKRLELELISPCCLDINY